MILTFALRNYSIINNPNNFFAMIINHHLLFKSLKKRETSSSSKDAFSFDYQQDQLNLIYIYYKRGKLSNVEKIIQQYTSLYPNQSNLDYVLYMRGLIYIKLDQYFWRKLFRLNLSNCNSEYALSAFHDFSQIILSYPESKYVTDARKHLVALQERLANYDLLIAKFYLRHGEYIAVIHRIEKMIRDYPQTKSTQIALSMVKRTYQKMKLKQPA
ncbi:MAG: outer membrane protein assembly factor BamD [Candidatus Dasytiphilus stammeri]